MNSSISSSVTRNKCLSKCQCTEPIILSDPVMSGFASAAGYTISVEPSVVNIAVIRVPNLSLQLIYVCFYVPYHSTFQYFHPISSFNINLKQPKRFVSNQRHEIKELLPQAFSSSARVRLSCNAFWVTLRRHRQVFVLLSELKCTSCSRTRLTHTHIHAHRHTHFSAIPHQRRLDQLLSRSLTEWTILSFRRI